MDAGFRAFRDLILSLWIDPNNLLHSLTETTRNTLNLAFARFPLCGREALESALRTAESEPVCMHERGQFLYMHPVTKDRTSIPAMALTCDFAQGVPEVRLQVVLFRSDEVEGRARLKAVGYRYEMPEGTNVGGQSIGKHDYCHAQPIRTIGKRLLPTVPWLPDEHPAFPLDATEPISLVFAMLTSLYGAKDAVKKLRDGRDVFWEARVRKTHLGKLHLA